MAETPGELRESVRQRYAEAATSVAAGGSGCCGQTAQLLETDVRFGSTLYTQLDRDTLPVAAVAASLGCGNPTAVADLHPGERVLDLGSGGGIDVILSAGRVGQAGIVYGVDMTTEMLELARANAAQAGVSNVEFRQGTIEDVPLPDAAVDVIISNCVINLSVDKPKVIAEMFRVLAPGGRIGISDVVAEDHLTPGQRADRGSYVGCIAGALSRSEYLQQLAAVGFADATVRYTADVADGMHNAIIQAVKPGDGATIRQDTIRDHTTDADRAIAAGVGEATAGAEACCDTDTASTCCEPSAKTSCCGDAGAGLPASCGCR